MVQIDRNAYGVEGLHLATDCFTEEVERRIFSAEERCLPERKGHRSGRHSSPMNYWPNDYTNLTNLIRDSAGFHHHYDSRHRWGEVIVGVTIGQSGVLYFVPKKGQESLLPPGDKKSIEVTLPRRSIYIMSGASRYDFTHGIAKVPSIDLPSPPSWNKMNVRISLTFRSTKVYSDVYLGKQLKNERDAKKQAELRVRIAAQEKYYPVKKKNGPPLTKAEVEVERKKANALLKKMDDGEIQVQLRFHQHEVTFPLPTSFTSNGYNNTGATLAPAAVFAGVGRSLGSAHKDEMKTAIDASLRSFAEERAARRRKIDHGSRSSALDEREVIDLLSDGEDDQKMGARRAKKQSPEVIVIDD